MKLTLAILAELVALAAAFMFFPSIWQSTEHWGESWSAALGAAFVSWLAGTVGCILSAAVGKAISPDKAAHSYSIIIFVVLLLGDMAILTTAIPFNALAFGTRLGFIFAAMVNARMDGLTFRKTIA